MHIFLLTKTYIIMNGYLMLSIVTLIFLVIYLYSYQSVAMENKKRKAILEKKRHLQLAINARLKELADRRHEKLERFIERSIEIRRELVKLKNTSRVKSNPIQVD